MSTEAWVLAGVLALLWVRRRAANRAAAAQWEEELPVNGTDFQGDLWARLSGVDLLAKPGERNLANGTIADPGKVGQADLGLVPDWRGDL